MTAASAPRDVPGRERLLTVDVRTGHVEDHAFAELPHLLDPGDLLVVNDAATLPASLAGSARAEPVEVRLLGERDDGSWDAVLFGAGDWQTRTEDRPPPPMLAVGEAVALGGALSATIESVSALSPRLVNLRFALPRDALVPKLYAHGRPVQYAHLRAPVDLRDVQTPFASRPWAAEMPSAGRPLSLALLARLRRGGIAIATLTHAAGLSSTGDRAIDRALPLPERFEIPAATVAAVDAARARCARAVAVGTTVVRALEGCAAQHRGRLAAGPGITDLRLGPGAPRRIVDAILTGIHEAGTSHHDLLGAFAPLSLVDRALAVAEDHGYLGHEFGDSMLVVSPRRICTPARAGAGTAAAMCG